jgi:hypothetical protein
VFLFSVITFISLCRQYTNPISGIQIYCKNILFGMILSESYIFYIIGLG